MDEANFEGEDFFSLLSEELMQEETPPRVLQTSFPNSLCVE